MRLKNIYIFHSCSNFTYLKRFVLSGIDNLINELFFTTKIDVQELLLKSETLKILRKEK